MSATLTKRQAECLAAIKAFKAEHGHAPTYAELADLMRLWSRSNAHRLVLSMVDRGVVRMGQGRRAIQIIEGHAPAEIHARAA